MRCSSFNLLLLPSAALQMVPEPPVPPDRQPDVCQAWYGTAAPCCLQEEKKKIKPKWNANPSWMRERHVESVRKETPSKREGWKRNKSNQQIKQTRSWRRRCESCRFKVKGQLAGGGAKGAKVCSSGCTASCCKTDHSELKRHQKIFSLTFRAEQRGRASISAADTQIHSMLL